MAAAPLKSQLDSAQAWGQLQTVHLSRFLFCAVLMLTSCQVPEGFDPSMFQPLAVTPQAYTPMPTPQLRPLRYQRSPTTMPIMQSDNGDLMYPGGYSTRTSDGYMHSNGGYSTSDGMGGMMHSNGTHSYPMGNSMMHSDGSRTERMGNMLYHHPSYR
jgi:hypothetical protein